jgi:O-antigen ligase
MVKSGQSLAQRRKDAKGRAEDDKDTIKGAGNVERVTQRRRGAETQRVGNDGEVSASPHLPASRGPYALLPIIHAFLIGGALVGLVGILQYWGINLAPLIGDEVGFSQDVLFVEGVLRVNSVYGHANNLALYMGRIWPVACILALAAYDHRRVWHTLFYALCTALSIGGMYVAFSKGAQIGAMGALGVLLLLQLLRELRRLAPGEKPSVRRLAPLLVLLLLFLFMLASGLRVERLNWLGASSGVRVKTWLATLEIIQAHPLLGIGMDQFNPAYQQVMHPSLRGTTEQYISHPHNLLLDIWLRMGILGLIAFGWLIVRFYRAVWRRSVDTIGFNAEAQRRKEAERGAKQRAYTQELSVSAIIGFAAAMTAALLHGLVDNFYFVPDLAFAFWLGVGVVTIART